MERLRFLLPLLLAACEPKAPADLVPHNGKTTMEETITGYGAKAAYLTREENIKGTLEPGKLADIVVLSDDLLTIDPERILDVQVLMTIVNGKMVYERS